MVAMRGALAEIISVYGPKRIFRYLYGYCEKQVSGAAVRRSFGGLEKTSSRRPWQIDRILWTIDEKQGLALPRNGKNRIR